MDTPTPFPRGGTMFEGAPPNATDGANILGKEFWLEDTIHKTGRLVRVRAVRNSAAAAVLPKRLAVLNYNGTAITGYTRLPNERGFPIDELLPSGGCAVNDVCYVVVKGPALVLPSLDNFAADIAAGDRLNAQTAATSGATTAGRPDLRAVAAATADATAGQRNVTEQDGVFGRAISTALTNGTGDILVDIGEL